VLRLEVVHPLDVVAGGCPGWIGSLLGGQASLPGPDHVPLVLHALRRRRWDADAVDGYPPPAAAWQAHVRQTGYPARYTAHASSTVRLPRPKPFAAVLLRDDGIGAAREEDIRSSERLERRDWNGEGRRGALIVQRRQTKRQWDIGRNKRRRGWPRGHARRDASLHCLGRLGAINVD
jgi:hypothetical protein